jgi:hypothetical protein
MGDSAVFQSFEAAVSNHAIMSCQDRLICTYPGPSVQVPLDVTTDPDFQYNLSVLLEQMDTTDIDEAQVKTKKGGAHHQETREPPSPAYITEFLTALLLGFGTPHESLQFTKRIRDEVNIEASKLPWRRSPFWLVMRVFLQLRLYAPDQSFHHLEFKCFMLHVLTSLLERVLKAGFESEAMLWLMKKLARRSFKLGHYPESSKVAHRAKLAADSAKAELDRRWLEIQKASVRKIVWNPDSLDLEADTRLKLANSLPYIQSRMSYLPKVATPTAVLPPSIRRLNVFVDIPNNFLAQHKSSATLQRRIALLDFEEWTEKHMEEWRQARESTALLCEKGCEELRDAIELYASVACGEYDGDPEHISIMALTISSLWETLDRLTTSLFPILEEYSPEIPIDVFRALVLPTRGQMERLHRFESYLRSRHEAAQRHPTPSIFSSEVSHRSFSVRTYNGSQSMQDARQRIEEEAGRCRRHALEELSNAKETYAEISKRRDEEHPSCECYWTGGRRSWKVFCERCKLGERMQKVTVSKFEWPLPSGSPHVEAALFELMIPSAFRDWRDVTYEVITKHLSSPKGHQRSSKQYSFESYSVLKSEMRPVGSITWSSTAKPINSSHYGGASSVQVTPSTEASAVCFPHALHYGLYYQSNPLVFPSEDAMREKCTPHLPSGCYKVLQQWVSNVTHTQNEVIARQSKCHMDLDIHEFVAFGSLRAGELLQWMNIYRELGETNLTLSNHEVHILLSHASSQCGTTGDHYLRQAHAELESSYFCVELLSAIATRLSAIADNWHERYSLLTLCHLVRRVLSVSGLAFHRVRVTCVQLLQQIIRISLSWIHSLKADAKTAANPTAIQDRLLHVALIGRLTFDVDLVFLKELLFDDNSVEHLVLFHACIHEYSASTTERNAAQSLKPLMLRNDRLSAKLASRLFRLVAQDLFILSNGVRKLWPTLRPLAIWQRNVSSPDWTECNQFDGGRMRVTHFNTMTGELLVDGAPVGRLPTQISRHASYQRLFEKVSKE